jgi:hypothetical protein
MIRLSAVPRTQGGRSAWEAAMLIRYAPMHSPCDPAVVSADVGGHPGSVKAA